MISACSKATRAFPPVASPENGCATFKSGYAGRPPVRPRRAETSLLRLPLTRSVDTLISDDGHGAFRSIGDHGVPAIWKPFELHEMRREPRRDIRLALYWVYRIIFATEHKGRTLDARKIRQHVRREALATRSCEPMQDLCGLTARRAPSGSRGVRACRAERPISESAPNVDPLRRRTVGSRFGANAARIHSYGPKPIGISQ